MDLKSINDVYTIYGESFQSLGVNVLIPLLLEVAGAFLGVFGAIWLSKKEAREKRNELVRSLNEELKSIQNELKLRLQQNKRNDYYYRYPTQIWNINTRAGALQGLSLKDYKIYIELYSQIEFAQEIEREWFHCSFLLNRQGNDEAIRKTYVAVLNRERWKLAENIYMKITELFGADSS